MWSNTCNHSNDFPTFKDEFSKGNVNSTVTFLEQYHLLCSKYKIIPCPFVKVENLEAGKTSSKIINCDIDTANWRAFLTASDLASNNVEICIVNCILRGQHLIDLTTFLQANCQIECVKLDYVYHGENKEEFLSNLQNVINSATNIKYLSLKGNYLGDEDIESIKESLKSCVSLQCLNLSDNSLSVEISKSFMPLIPLLPSLRYISLKNNKIDIINLDITELLNGLQVNQTIENDLKVISKQISERNKRLKEHNKARKKSGLEEIDDIEAASGRITKVSGSNTIRNNDFCLDISRNTNDNEALIEFLKSSHTKVEASSTAGITPPKLVIKLLSSSSEIRDLIASNDWKGFVEFI